MDSRPLGQVLVPAGTSEKAGPKAAPVGSWQLLAIAGWAFLVVGVMDVGLVWYPAAFGNAGWEFGSITTSLNGFPLPVMGLALVLASATARAKGGQARLVLVVGVVAILAIAAMAVLYGLTAPVAYRSVSDPIALSGLKKAIVRSLIQLVVYPVVLMVLVWRALGLMKRGDG